MMEKYCIVHLPYKINKERPSGPNIRPTHIIDALNSIGYEVSLIEGNSNDRKEQIKQIENEISKGKQFSFVYSEASTMPTELTDPDHIPRNYGMDFRFFNFCKQFNIPITLFYRDVYWKYEQYKNENSFLKRTIATHFYKRDIKKYNELVSLLYVPGLGYLNKIDDLVKIPVKELPPGFNIENIVNDDLPQIDTDSDTLKLLYVGGVNNMYDIKELFEVVSSSKGIESTVITRESDWNDSKSEYSNLMSDNIKILHLQGSEIEKYYEWADLLMLTIKPNEYREMAVPIKLFEYIGHAKPIIAYNGSLTGKYVEEHQVGESVDYGSNQLEQVLSKYRDDRTLLSDFNIDKIAKLNTWEQRVLKIESDVEKMKRKKVLILSDASNAHTRKWVKQTQEEGYEVVVVSLNKGSIQDCKVYDFSEENQVSRSLMSKVKYLRHLNQIKKIIDIESPDILHAHFASSYGLLASLLGEPYFLNVWGKDVYEFPKKNFVTKYIIKRVLKNAMKIYSTSYVMKDVTQQYTNKNIDVTPFGVEIDVFKPQEVKSNKEIFNIGYIKLIEVKYGVGDLITTFNQLVKKYTEQEFNLTIVGKGTQKNEMIKLSEDLGVSDQVTFIEYVNGQEKVAELYNDFDICVFPSIDDSESFGVSAVESMACGTPTIVSDVSGFKEITNNGEFAKMFERGNTDELFKLLEELYLNDDMRNELSISSSKHVVNNYNVKDNFKPVFEDYLEYLDKIK